MSRQLHDLLDELAHDVPDTVDDRLVREVGRMVTVIRRRQRVRAAGRVAVATGLTVALGFVVTMLVPDTRSSDRVAGTPAVLGPEACGLTADEAGWLGGPELELRVVGLVGRTGALVTDVRLHAEATPPGLTGAGVPWFALVDDGGRVVAVQDGTTGTEPDSDAALAVLSSTVEHRTELQPCDAEGGAGDAPDDGAVVAPGTYAVRAVQLLREPMGDVVTAVSPPVEVTVP